MPRARATIGKFDVSDDKLDAVERGLEWGAAMLKARGMATAPPGKRLQRALHQKPEASPPLGPRGRQPHHRRGSGDQEALFERLASIVSGAAAGSWDCTIAGTGGRMTVSLAESESSRAVWSRAGSAAELVTAFEEWLSEGSSSQDRGR